MNIGARFESFSQSVDHHAFENGLAKGHDRRTARTWLNVQPNTTDYKLTRVECLLIT